MRLTHFGHSCVLLEISGTRLLFDPGTFSSGFEDVRDLDAVLITHQHPDHVDTAKLPDLLAANPTAQLVVDVGTAPMMTESGLAHQTVRAGETFSVGSGDGVRVAVVGGEHATIHPDIPIVDNVGYLVGDGAFYHPGDAFAVPERAVDVLALPTGAPWLKVSEAVDFLREVAPRVAVPIHEAVLAWPQMHYRLFSSLGPEGAQVRILQQREVTEI